ncbi:polysaccharide biosynthesis tyrosine autokinase [Aliifodinibius sp. S!AR15-10]|uniref:GumC family protein n=1 Tax=Aliifodinibius sp. S!AR15-10 TaxID=2950437 RepID=UPI00285ABD8E|nr:polysaccharide biosynthesis tyrosine autokinase [Aliifodinibius sp. S!AR15-10]MDR8392371.1 polysaccharide biosynthesis tyrosine autokinase [Aliifodinibius sp. S!AR15-10]
MSDSIQKRNNNGMGSDSKSQFIPDFSFRAESNEKNELDPQKIISTILRYKWLIMVFMIAGTIGAWFYADTITPTYESKGTLMIQSEGSNEELSQIISRATGVGTRSTLINELQVLQSRQFALQVAQKLIEEDPGNINQFPVLWTEDMETGEISRVSEGTVASRIMRSLSFLQPNPDSDVVEISFTSPSPQEAAKVVNEAMNIYVENSKQQSRQAAEKTAEFLNTEKEKMRQKLQASEEKLRRYMDSTGFVRVDQQASNIVAQKAETEAELQRINLELETIEQTISIHENQLESIKPGLSEQFSEAIGPKIRASQEELAQYERERTLIIAKNPGVLERDPVPARLKFLNDQIEHLKNEIKGLSEQLFTDNDVFMGMDSQVRAEMVSGIQTSLTDLRIEQNQLKSRRAALTQNKQEMDSNFNSLPEGMIELEKLQRDVRMNEELYLNVSRQYADMSIWEQSQFGFARIIDLGQEPNSPVSPNKKILLILGLMLGGLFSAVFITLREFKDNSVKSVDLLRTTYLPTLTLSVIPSFEKISRRDRKTFNKGEGIIPDEMVMLYDRTSIASEAIRRIKNNIIYQNGDTPPKTIAVTSPEKGDGKSTVVANLGVAFADEGYKTLVIGADFRRPKLRNYFGLNDMAGLSDYLNGKIPVVQLIQDSELDTLKVVTAGNETERPEIIGSSLTFKQFLKKMEEMFDVIILDTPPYGIISDSTSLLKDAEITLVVAKYRKTNRGMLLRTIEDLGRIQANVAGIVLNDFNHKKEVGQYYGEGYYQALYSNYKNYKE